MDHDDAHRGLDELSRLFETGTAPVPAVTPEEEASPALAPPRPEKTLSAFGQSLPPVYTPAPSVAPGPAVVPPPPLVPAAPVSSSNPPGPSPIFGASAAPLVAPAFGGVPIAVPHPRAPEHAPVPLPAPPPVAAFEPVTPAAPPPPVAETVPVVAALSPPTRVLSAPSGAPPTPYSGVGPLVPGGSTDDIVDDDQVARSTLAEKIFFILTIVLPPIGLIGTAVAALGSMRRRGWVTGLLRAGLAVGIVMSVVSAGGAYAGYKVVRQQQAHAQTVAASAAFCAAFAKDKTLGTGDGGWPQPAASIADSLTAMQAYVDRWNALAKVSPEGVQQGVANVAVAGAEVIKTVQVQRTIDDAENRPILASAVSSAGIADWRANYCE